MNPALLGYAVGAALVVALRNRDRLPRLPISTTRWRDDNPWGSLRGITYHIPCGIAVEFSHYSQSKGGE